MNADAAEPRTGVEVAEGLATDAEQRRRLVSYARSRFGIGEEEAEDLLQDTLLELMRTEGLIHRPDGFAFRVFHTRCCNHLRRVVNARVGSEAAARAGALGPRPDAAESADADVFLRQGLSRVSATCRTVLTAYYVEGRSLKETARALSLSVTTTSVFRLVNTCLKKLRQYMERR